MTAALDARALQYACRRVEDFALVNRDRSHDERMDAIYLWLDHLGLDEGLLNTFLVWVESFEGPGWDPSILLGLAVGLLVNQFYADNPAPTA